MQALITGGAGFIGSAIARALVSDGHDVRVLDNLTTGYRENVPDAAELIEGSIVDESVVEAAMAGIEIVFHQAAERAVIKSVQHPLPTSHVNVQGTLTVLEYARQAGVGRLVSASSSSVYGGAELRPTPESAPLLPRSPYAVSKLCGEHYCRVYAELYGLETVSLRYFNVFGPRQRPDSMYAAVIPLFMAALLTGQRPTVHGDGLQTRDFTFVDDAVRANLAAASAPAEHCAGRAFNVGGGTEHSLLDVLSILSGLTGVAAEPVHTEPRAGDVRHSLADLGAIEDALGYEAERSLEAGLAQTLEHFHRD